MLTGLQYFRVSFADWKFGTVNFNENFKIISVTNFNIIIDKLLKCLLNIFTKIIFLLQKYVWEINCICNKIT